MVLYSDFEGLAPVAVRFMVAGLRDNEYVVALLPLEEMAQWRPLFDRALQATEGLEKSGTLQIIPLLPSRLTGDTGPLDLVPLMRRVIKEARIDGRTAVRALGRLSPALLERGHERNAVAIEKFASEQRFPLRILCMYEATSFAAAPPTTVNALVRAHTHSIAHITGDEYLVEAL